MFLSDRATPAFYDIVRRISYWTRRSPGGSTTIKFDFLAPRRIVFGWGRRTELGGLAARLGRRALLATGSRTLERLGVIEELVGSLHAAGLEVARIGGVYGEPTVEAVDRLVIVARESRPRIGDVVVAVGGGAALDAGKAVAGLALEAANVSVQEYLEGVGTGRTISTPPLPIVAVPTTAGTGAEATKNAVISGSDPPFKKSLRDDRAMPAAALVDPELTVSNPPAVTAASGMDAICQLMESVLSKKSQPTTRVLALGALPGLGVALRTAHVDPENRAARERMSWAALHSGMALANSGLGLAHAAAAALGALVGAPHGLACAVMLPVALEFNAAARPDDMRAIAQAFLGDGRSASTELIAEVRALNRQLHVPDRLAALGVTSERIPDLVRLTAGSSLDGNPRQTSPEQLAELYATLI